MKKYFLGAGVIGLAVILGLTGTLLVVTHCPSSGYEKHSLYAQGRFLSGAPYAGWFPELQDGDKFKSAGIRYVNYDHFDGCTGWDASEADRVEIVKFSVAQHFRFTRSAKYEHAAQVLNWAHEPIDAYIPATVTEPQKMQANDSGPARSWLSQPLDAGYKETVDLLGVPWLKSEALDAEHLMGIWHRGWLFSSTTPGHYIWISL